jgi:hypothetical protein
MVPCALAPPTLESEAAAKIAANIKDLFMSVALLIPNYRLACC